MARSSWTHITGKVIASSVYKMYGGAGQGASAARWKYIVEICPAGEEARRVEIKQDWGLLRRKMINPMEGSRFPLLLDAKSGDVRFDVDDPAINWKASMKADAAKREREFDRNRES
jgi:hypothetical protein